MTLDKEKYSGIIPAFYACYDDQGNVSPERTRELAKHYLDAGVKGLYVGGSSGECIYQSVEERKLTLESVMEVVGNKMTIIAHVAATSTKDSVELAKHAENLGVDALAAIPPIYFVLPEDAIRAYWGEIVEATDLDFFIYNIPGTTGYALTVDLLLEMLKYPNVAGVKNSSMPVQDIYKFKQNATRDIVIFNGPDEQFVAGRIMGADGGIGGTYGIMPELFIAADNAIRESRIDSATEIQYAINDIIFSLFECTGNMYSVEKEILRRKGINIGVARKPLAPITDEDSSKIDDIIVLIEKAYNQFVN